MRHFILGSSAVTSGIVASVSTEGAVGLAYLNDGILTFDDGTHIKDKGYIVLVRSAANGGNVVLPFYRNKFRYVKGVYQAAVPFEAAIKMPTTINPDCDYTIIVAKKGVGFNERNRWTATVRAKASDDAESIANKLAKYINDNIAALGITAEVDASAATSDGVYIGFDGPDSGEDYAVICADELIDVVPTITAGKAAYGDAKYVADLAAKAAADAGFEYTYQDDVKYLYPKYPFNPIAQSNEPDTYFAIYTLNFAEPREVKTVDDVINQVVQIAFDDDEFTGLDAVLANLVDATVGDITTE